MSSCNGELLPIVNLPSQAKSRILQFGQQLLKSEYVLCTAHATVLSRKKQVNCCDPFKVHAKPCKGKFFIEAHRLKKELQLSRYEEFRFKPGDSLCPSCNTKLDTAKLEDVDMEEIESDPTENEKVEKLNKVLAELGLEEINFDRRNTSGKNKLIKETANRMQEMVISLFGIPPSKAENQTKFNQVIERVKEKIQTSSSKREQTKLLSLFSGILTVDTIIETFNVSRRMASNASLLYKEQGILGEPAQKRGKPLNDEIVQAVLQIYIDDEYSRASPNQRDTIKDSAGEYISKRFLLVTLEELHAIFKAKYPEFKISFSKFAQLRPKHVELIGKIKKQVCVCIYHDNLDMLFEALGIIKYAKYLDELICQDKENKKDCMYRRCGDCKNKTESFLSAVRNHVEETKPELQDLGVKFKLWVRTSRDTQVEQVMSYEDFLNHLLTVSTDTLKHHKVAKQQSQFQKSAKASVTDDSAVIQCDFSENYATEYSRETQALHFNKEQTTIHPFVVTARRNGLIETRHLVLISDTKDHITNTYFAFQQRMLTWLKQEYPCVKHVMYFTDGASSQYKNFKNFTNLYFHLSDFGIAVTHHFFASCHGKGPCDGIGGIVKAKVRRASLAGTIIEGAMDFYNYLLHNIKSTAIIPIFMSDEEIQEVVSSFNLQNRYDSSIKMPHIRQIHKVVPDIQNGSLNLFELSSDNQPCSIVRIQSQLPTFNSDDVEVGEFVAAIYQNNWYYGKIIEKDEEEEEFQIHFLEGQGNSGIEFNKFESRPLYIPFGWVICKVAKPRYDRKKERWVFTQRTRKNVETKFKAQASN